MDVTITDPVDVRRILADPAHRVPEADAASASATEALRAATSRFVNGAVHELRRARLEQRLAELDPAELARTAARLTHEARRAGTPGISAFVPVASLAEHLGFDAPDELPPLIAEIAAVYATGIPSGASSATADAATRRAIAAAPERDPALAVQLLVQAQVATSALIDGARRALATDPDLSTRAALEHTLRLDPPAPSTRRIGPDGTLVVLRLGGGGDAHDSLDSHDSHDSHDDVTASDLPASLAFGAGPRSCPAPAHALAIAAAVVDGLREAEPSITPEPAAGGVR